MTVTHSQHSHRRIDLAGLALLLFGLLCLCASYWLTVSQETNPLFMIPSVVVVVTGARHITKREVTR